jgi:hypothetical protein
MHLDGGSLAACPCRVRAPLPNKRLLLAEPATEASSLSSLASDSILVRSRIAIR